MTDDRDAVRAWLALLKTANTLRKTIDAALRERFGVSISRFDVLAALDRAGAEGARAGLISHRLMVTEGNTTQITAPLIRDGFVRRSPDPNDARAALFTLTRKGATLFAEMAREHRRVIAVALEDLSGPELEALRHLLLKVRVPSERGKAEKDAA